MRAKLTLAHAAIDRRAYLEDYALVGTGPAMHAGQRRP